jgi:hypothetical protein
MNILLKYPSRGRPEKFKNTLKKHCEYLSYNHQYNFVFSFDDDDETMNNIGIQEEIKQILSNKNIEYTINYSQNKNKIEAINNDLTNKKFDILILLADDVIPILEKYDEIIVNLFSNSPLLLDSTIHFYTAMWSHILDIWCVMGYDYYKRFEYIYHPSYKNIFSDNEYTEVSRLLNRTILSEESPFIHDWESDEITAKNSEYSSSDWLVYDNRKQNNFFITNQQ